jgi:hypothetical protein
MFSDVNFTVNQVKDLGIDLLHQRFRLVLEVWQQDLSGVALIAVWHCRPCGNRIEGDAFVEAVGQPLALRVRHFAFT